MFYLIIFCVVMNGLFFMISDLHSRGEMARLRLTAALCILKIVHVGAYAEIVTNETFQNLALIINVCLLRSPINTVPTKISSIIIQMETC